jgi:hypothetical protein
MRGSVAESFLEAPRIVGRLTELIIPATGVIIGLAVGIRLKVRRRTGTLVGGIGIPPAPPRRRRRPRGAVP